MEFGAYSNNCEHSDSMDRNYGCSESTNRIVYMGSSEVILLESRSCLRGENYVRLIKWLSMIILLVLVIGSLFLFSKVHIASNGVTYQDKTALNSMNIIIDTPNAPAKINPIVAIVDAVKTYHPRLFSLDRINVEYQLMTATAGGHSLSKEPVFIVSFVSNKVIQYLLGRL